MVTTVYHVKKCLDASLRPYATHSRRRCSPRPTSHWIILDRSRRVAPDCHARPRCLRHMPGWRASRSEPGEVARAVSTRASRRGCGSAWLGDTQYSNCQYLYVMMHTYLSMEAGVFSVQGRRPIAQQRALQSSTGIKLALLADRARSCQAAWKERKRRWRRQARPAALYLYVIDILFLEPERLGSIFDLK